ncbi:fumarate/nitrate reduction transcriptional regulator Fnr [Cupriavidus basilensis]
METCVHCLNCKLRHMCFPSMLNQSEMSRFNGIIDHRRKVRRGQRLYSAGDTFQNIYVPRIGSFKTVLSSEHGAEHVTGFYLIGETLGLSGISTKRHIVNAIALEDSVACVIPFQQLESLCREMPRLQQHIYKLLSAEIAQKSQGMIQLGSMTAEQRVAAFLLNISARLGARSYSITELSLHMTRGDIGNYLGMTLETVSRTFSRFQKNGLIRVRGKNITLSDAHALNCL